MKDWWRSAAKKTRINKWRKINANLLQIERSNLANSKLVNLAAMRVRLHHLYMTTSTLQNCSRPLAVSIPNNPEYQYLLWNGFDQLEAGTRNVLVQPRIPKPQVKIAILRRFWLHDPWRKAPHHGKTGGRIRSIAVTQSMKTASKINKKRPQRAAEPSWEVTEPRVRMSEPCWEVTEPRVRALEPSWEGTERRVRVAEPSWEVTEPSHWQPVTCQRVAGREDLESRPKTCVFNVENLRQRRR